MSLNSCDQCSPGGREPPRWTQVPFRIRVSSNRRPPCDLAPTLDVRSVFKGVLRDHPGVDRAALDARVFPGSAAEAPALDGLV